MNLKIAAAVAVLQVLVLGYMAGQREWIMRTGTPLTLRTAPVDPTDPMRGAYVRLNYEISTVPAALCQGETAQWLAVTDYQQQRRLRDRVVYAVLKTNAHGQAELVALRETPPPEGPYLRGRVVSVDANGIRVRYGIEALFMAREAAIRTEGQALTEKAGAPMAVSVAVGRDGTAVLKDYAWEPLGLTITLHRPPETEPRDPNRPWMQAQRPINALTATLHNYSDRDLAIVDLPRGRSFRLVPNRLTNADRYTWAPPHDMGAPTPESPHIIVLKPGATHAIQIDLTQPEWWVLDTAQPDAQPVSLAEIRDWTASFRLEYDPPAAETVRGLPHADLVRHVPLPSRAFSPMQGID